MVYPIELRTNANNGDEHEDDYATTPRNYYSADLAWSQVINQRLQVSFDGELIYQKGYLGLPFHRVYFNDASVHVEHLPSTRFKVPLGVRANYFLGDKFIIRTWYRNYHDDWCINSNTLQIETSVKINPFFSITPFYRYYQQSAVKYFAPYEDHTTDDEYYTSNYDLSKFNSNFFGAGFRIAPPKGVFNIQHVNALEIRYGHYKRSDGLSSNIVSLSLKFK